MRPKSFLFRALMLAYRIRAWRLKYAVKVKA